MPPMTTRMAREATNFDIWGADNGLTATWDESCLKAHALDPDLRACRDSRHVMTHHLQTPTFFAAQSADRNLRTTDKFLTMWSPEGTVWWPEDMKLRVEKLAEVISGYQNSLEMCGRRPWGAWLLFRQHCRSFRPLGYGKADPQDEGQQRG